MGGSSRWEWFFKYLLPSYVRIAKIAEKPTTETPRKPLKRRGKEEAEEKQSL
jgi:hypothetical protein